jgi:hypothetical protein
MSGNIACVTCGRFHPMTQSELTFGLPDVVFAMSEEERDARCELSADIVALDRDRFFIRGLLPLEVTTRGRPYNLGVWAEVSPSTFGRVYELWSEPNQEREPRMPGKLANNIPFHPDACNLAVGIQLTGPSSRPEFYLEAAEHTLYGEQSHGIDEHRAIEYSDPAARKAAVEQAASRDRSKTRST